MTDHTNKDLEAAWRHISRYETAKERLYQDSKGVPTIGVGYTPIVYDKGAKKWGLREGYKDDFKAAGITLTEEQDVAFKRLESDMNSGGAEDNPRVAEGVKAMGSIDLGKDGSKRLFEHKYSEYATKAKKAVGAGVFDGLSSDQKAVLTGIAYQSPAAMARAGGEISKHVKAGDMKAAANRIRAIGGELNDKDRYIGAGDFFENPALPGKVMVERDDNLTKIAKAKNTSVEALVKLNNISDPNNIRAGTTLILPKDGDEDVIEDDRPEVKKFMEDLTKPDRLIDEVLLKDPKTWTKQEVRDVMAERNRRPGHDPEFDEIVGKERTWFSHFYGDGPAKVDETGRIVEPKAIRSIPIKPTPATDAEGNGLTQNLKLIAKHVAGAAKDDGLARTVKALQGGLNVINRGRAKKERPSFPMLKEDGLFGTKTKSAVKKTVAKHGSARAEEGLALGRFRDFTRDAQKKNNAGGLGKFSARTMGPLFRNPRAKQTERAPKVESSVLQETVNDLGSSHFGRDKWKPLKEDGWIGPKSEDAFSKVARTAGPEKMTERFGGFLGFFD